jgi:hypothetical protein
MLALPIVTTAGLYVGQLGTLGVIGIVRCVRCGTWDDLGTRAAAVMLELWPRSTDPPSPPCTTQTVGMAQVDGRSGGALRGVLGAFSHLPAHP